MSQYRKKPVVVEAEPFDPVSLPLPFKGRGDPVQFNGVKWYIETLEGSPECTPGDMVIRGVKGEFYPCKPDIFAATYESVEAKGWPKDARPVVDRINAAVEAKAEAGESSEIEKKLFRMAIEMPSSYYAEAYDEIRRLRTRTAPTANTEGLQEKGRHAD